ncbi:(Fe-S)-binding protein [Catenisphaera adipataccumulans]|jgi:electron transport complex protein RnfB|uniref:Electron transport complex protein RnfB n=1 Tax=Catenisphaera adipataccumulans TaxID=700500 RepID=A0A7W8D0D7_9FIRM|nr:(Fe-S)-binding protein [Catenisphaera adipataccumulans]MBB5183260.1 electron transport complex protein RnfB [Catenisphaera adipataccumulans]
MAAAIIMMLILGAILGFGLGIADSKLKVEVDERVEKVTNMLPGYNCGGCGYPGCSGFAEAMVSGEVDHYLCKPSKPDQKAEIIDYLKNTPGPDGSTVDIKA